jgi:hypothetical protein
MQLSTISKVIIILNYIINLLYYTIFYRVIKLQLNKFLSTIERDKSNIFLVFFNTRTFSILLVH